MSPIRLFYALWPDTPLANTLSTWATQAQPHSRGRAMRTETLHMTLAFLGSVEKEIADELIAATPYHPLQPGTGTLARHAVFARPPTLWGRPPPASRRSSASSSSGSATSSPTVSTTAPTPRCSTAR
jgi:2'-5' RNA ligase